MNHAGCTSGVLLYRETLSSNRTQAVFLGLATIFTLLSTWRITTHRVDRLAKVFAFFAFLFFFYVLNYRTLTIHLTSKALRLTFGLFTWTIPPENIASAALDELPVMLRYGGAGVHFMTVRNRYRASFNFLEHPRVVIALKHKLGPVQEISFSTRHPAVLLGHIETLIRA